MFSKLSINNKPEIDINNNLSLKFHLLFYELKDIDINNKLSDPNNYNHVKRLLNEMIGLIDYLEIKNKSE